MGGLERLKKLVEKVGLGEQSVEDMELYLESRGYFVLVPVRGGLREAEVLAVDPGLRERKIREIISNFDLDEIDRWVDTIKNISQGAGEDDLILLTYEEESYFSVELRKRDTIESWYF